MVWMAIELGKSKTISLITLFFLCPYLPCPIKLFFPVISILSFHPMSVLRLGFIDLICYHSPWYWNFLLYSNVGTILYSYQQYTRAPTIRKDFSGSMSTLVNFFFLSFFFFKSNSHPRRYKVIPYYSFDLHLPDDITADLLYTFFKEMFIKSLAHF